MTNPYDDIIHLPHPTSTKHPRMSVRDRAAQFSPFAALTGYEGAIRETARLTCERAELSEDRKAILDQALRLAAQSGSDAVITYFLPDAKKEGGAYVTAAGTIKKIDEIQHVVILTSGVKIPIEEITEIESEITSFFFDSEKSYPP